MPRGIGLSGGKTNMFKTKGEVYNYVFDDEMIN